MRQTNESDGSRYSTFVRPMAAVFLALFLAAVAGLAGFVWHRLEKDAAVSFLQLAGFSLLMFAGSVLLFIKFSLRLREGFSGTIGKLHDMLSGNREMLRGHMEGSEGYEIGQLRERFNQIQDEMNRRNMALEQELRYAYQVQRDLLPSEVKQRGPVHIAARCRQTDEVGGDFYDVVELQDERIAVLVGDVSGKGVPAALLMSAMLALFRREVVQSRSASEVLLRLNQAVVEIVGSGMMVTAGLAVIDSAGSTVQYASAGHMAPYLVAVDGSRKEVPVSSLPLGIDDDPAYEEIRLDFPVGSLLVMYTDGIVEAGTDYWNGGGFIRLEQSLAELPRSRELHSWMDDFMDRLEQLSAGTDHTDDRTLLIAAHARIG